MWWSWDVTIDSPNKNWEGQLVRNSPWLNETNFDLWSPEQRSLVISLICVAMISSPYGRSPVKFKWRCHHCGCSATWVMSQESRRTYDVPYVKRLIFRLGLSCLDELDLSNFKFVIPVPYLNQGTKVKSRPTGKNTNSWLCSLHQSGLQVSRTHDSLPLISQSGSIGACKTW